MVEKTHTHGSWTTQAPRVRGNPTELSTWTILEGAWGAHFGRSAEFNFQSPPVAGEPP